MKSMCAKVSHEVSSSTKSLDQATLVNAIQFRKMPYSGPDLRELQQMRTHYGDRPGKDSSGRRCGSARRLRASFGTPITVQLQHKHCKVDYKRQSWRGPLTWTKGFVHGERDAKR